MLRAIGTELFTYAVAKMCHTQTYTILMLKFVQMYKLVHSGSKLWNLFSSSHNMLICDMIYSMEAKVGISKVEIQVKIGCGGEFWQKWVIYVVIKFETSTS